MKRSLFYCILFLLTSALNTVASEIVTLQLTPDDPSVYGASFYKVETGKIGFYGGVHFTYQPEEGDEADYTEDLENDIITNRYNEYFFANLGIIKSVNTYIAGYIGIGPSIKKERLEVVDAEGKKYFLEDTEKDRRRININVGILLFPTKWFVIDGGYNSITKRGVVGLGYRF